MIYNHLLDATTLTWAVSELSGLKCLKKPLHGRCVLGTTDANRRFHCVVLERVVPREFEVTWCGTG